MSSRRIRKAAQAIREVVSMAILAELKDPRIADVTVTYVELTPDMRTAKVHVSVMGDDKKQTLCLYGLRHSAGFLQQKITQRIDSRHTPRLEFLLDMGVKKSIQITQILAELFPADATPAVAEDPAKAGDAEWTELDSD
ncbi:MAG: ribosome-binding factor A [Planctomycetes bacterium RBG_16_64_10]|nr:MAG: ribosome-binding factor A [Planctomycetes bacterium RBG_16_64_10]